MKLTPPQLSFNDKLDEFDFWITPSLGDIRSSNRYREVQESICSLIEIIGATTNEFIDYSHFSAEVIARSIVIYIRDLTLSEKVSVTGSLATFLFLVTGKSDNNCKCQFPIFLRDVANVASYPKLVRRNGQQFLDHMEIPREIKSEKIARLIGDMSLFPQKQEEILAQYVSFIIDTDTYLRSLWTIGRTYFQMKPLGFEKDFLQPLIIFQIRGSVSASGGHEPENNLRDRMIEWGLKPNIDFNNSDIIINDINLENSDNITVDVSEKDTSESIILKVEETVKNKTRAYDFVLPYNVEGWDQRLYIQCQFYAGDSGSVSHKNVDQTRTSRDYVKSKRTNPIFLEYIDGAGYFSSLWGDLKKILAMTDTADFFQVRTAVIKLRSKLQEIGFLTPLEVVHAGALAEWDLKATLVLLEDEGYVRSEINRVLKDEIFEIQENRLLVKEEFIGLSRKYLLLDFIAQKGQTFNSGAKISGVLLVPAFGKFYGVRIEDVSKDIIPFSGSFKESWSRTALILEDIQYLADQGWIVQR